MHLHINNSKILISEKEFFHFTLSNAVTFGRQFPDLGYLKTCRYFRKFCQGNFWLYKYLILCVPALLLDWWRVFFWEQTVQQWCPSCCHLGQYGKGKPLQQILNCWFLSSGTMWIWWNALIVSCIENLFFLILCFLIYYFFHSISLLEEQSL